MCWCANGFISCRARRVSQGSSGLSTSWSVIKPPMVLCSKYMYAIPLKSNLGWLTLLLPWCHLKVTNKKATFEIHKPYFPLVLASAKTHSIKIKFVWYWIRNILFTGMCVPVNFTARGSEGVKSVGNFKLRPLWGQQQNGNKKICLKGACSACRKRYRKLRNTNWRVKSGLKC